MVPEGFAWRSKLNSAVLVSYNAIRALKQYCLALNMLPNEIANSENSQVRRLPTNGKVRTETCSGSQ